MKTTARVLRNIGASLGVGVCLVCASSAVAYAQQTYPDTQTPTTAPGATPPVSKVPIAKPLSCGNVQLTTYYAEYGGWSTPYSYSTGCDVAITYSNGYYRTGAYYYYNGWILSARGYVNIPYGNQYNDMITNLRADTAFKLNANFTQATYDVQN